MCEKLIQENNKIIHRGGWKSFRLRRDIKNNISIWLYCSILYLMTKINKYLNQSKINQYRIKMVKI